MALWKVQGGHEPRGRAYRALRRTPRDTRTASPGAQIAHYIPPLMRLAPLVLDLRLMAQIYPQSAIIDAAEHKTVLILPR